MKKRLMEYTASIDQFLADPAADTDWDQVIKDHLVQIGFFMHERLVHLIVTVWVSFLLFIALGLSMLTSPTPMLLLMITLFLVLLVPYLLHYYRLENGVQYMYQQYDRMLKYRG